MVGVKPNDIALVIEALADLVGIPMIQPVNNECFIIFSDLEIEFFRQVGVGPFPVNQLCHFYFGFIQLGFQKVPTYKVCFPKTFSREF